MASFETEYKRLNAAQRQAVDNIDGPLLVVAGPGTGKTQLLSMRVANILRKTDVYPDNILCLTFTNKAADNMKQRLLDLIGPESQAITVKTFHGLAAEVMNRYPEYFWRGARLSIAPEAVQLEVTRRVLMGLPADHPLTLKFAGQFTLVDDTTKAINLAKEAGLTPNKLRAIINANLEYIDQIEPAFARLGDLTIGSKNLDKIAVIVNKLPPQKIDKIIAPLTSLHTLIIESYETAVDEITMTGKTTPLSKWKSRWLQKNDGRYGLYNERTRNQWWLAIADAYEKYRQQLHQRGFYDYSDMLVEVISQIEQHEDLRANLQEQFQYVLIDEFQDTNAAQLRLAHLIADHTDLTNPNIMAVGDDDQSIFKFQGAELSNMLGFNRQYPTAQLIVLTDNYRSSQAILDTAETIINHAQYRLVNRLPDLSKQLIAVAPPGVKGNISHQSYRSREEQLDGLAKIAGQLFAKGKSVAILARKHSSLRDMAMLLHQNGTPINYEQSNNILEQPAIEQLLMILKIAARIKKGEVSQVNELLSLTLRHPMWQIQPETIWQFAVDQQTKYDWLSGMTSSGQASLTKIGDWFNWLAAASSDEPLAVIIEYVLGLRDNKIMPSPFKAYFFDTNILNEAYIETLSAVSLLRSMVTEFQSTGISKIEDFVRLIDLMLDSNKIIADSSPFVSGPKSVTLSTVYKAKGLEFDAVIVVDAINSDWSPRTRGRLPPANLPLRPAEDDNDDYVRLMYVAATRAKHSLIIGSYSSSHKGEDVLPAMSLGNIPATPQKPKAGQELVQILEQSLRWPQLDQTNQKALLKPRLENFVMNVSNLINFLDISRGGPQYFKERNLLRLPGAKTPAAAMGSAVHAALEEAQLSINANNYLFEAVTEKFESALRHEGLPENDYKHKLAEGKRLLNNFINKRAWVFNKGAHPEYKIVDAYVRQARVGGSLDILDTTGSTSLISDYKTGQPLSSLNINAGPDGLKAWRHKLQLVFYALLIEVDPAIRNKDETVCQMIYVEADSKSKQVIAYQPAKDELTRLGSLIQAVWTHVMNLDFPDISGYTPDAKGIKKFEDDLINQRI